MRTVGHPHQLGGRLGVFIPRRDIADLLLVNDGRQPSLGGRIISPKGAAKNPKVLLEGLNRSFCTQAVSPIGDGAIGWIPWATSDRRRIVVRRN